MADAQKLMLEGYEGRRERARLHRAPNEGCFGLQIATRRVSEGIFAGRLAAASGLDFLGTALCASLAARYPLPRLHARALPASSVVS